MLRAVAPDLIAPANSVPQPRKKRYRYRLRRLTPVGVAIVLAGAGGAWLGSHTSAEPIAAAATPRVPAKVAGPESPRPRSRSEGCAGAAPRRGALVPTFTPKLLGASAILVDAKTGRVVCSRVPRAAAGPSLTRS